MTPTNDQNAAIKAMVSWYKSGDLSPQEFYLAGYAGVGKSVTANFAIEEFRAKCRLKKFAAGALAGKAANVMRRKGIKCAATIHSQIYKPKKNKKTGEIRFKLSSTGPFAEADLIVLDECSMIDDVLASDVRSFGKKILVLGDPGQLPPVSGTGAFTKREPDFFLSEIHRQAADSPIIRLATLAREGKPIPLGDYGDALVLPLTRETQERVYDTNAQLLCGIHRVRWTYAQRIRKRLGFEGPRPLKGERVICRRNNRDLGIFNGSIGEMLEDADYNGDQHLQFSVKMEDLNDPIEDIEVHPYLFQQHFGGAKERPRMPRGVCEFDWGNVLTLHSAMGSEWERVTIVDDAHAFREHASKWRYTALTRASKHVTFLVRQ